MTEVKTKVCKKCGYDKPLSEYWAHPASVDKLQYKCIDCLTLERKGSKRPPLTYDQMKVLYSMLDLLENRADNDEWITGLQMIKINPAMKRVFNLVSRGIIEERVLNRGLKDVFCYRFTPSGLIIAKGVKALLDLEGAA